MSAVTVEWPVEEWTDWPGNTVVVLPCSGAKADGPTPAVDLYRSHHFTLGLRAARALVPDHFIRILSARHGLVPLDRVLHPYDTRWGDDDAVTEATIADQLDELTDDPLIGADATIVALTPKAYTLRIIEGPVDLVDALAGTRGICAQRGRLARISRLVDDSRRTCPDCGSDMATTWGDGTCVPCNPKPGSPWDG